MVTSYTQTNLVKYDEKRYLSQFVSDMFGSLQYDSNKHALIYKLNSFLTMATCWVPDLTNIRNFSKSEYCNPRSCKCLFFLGGKFLKDLNMKTICPQIS